MEMRFGTIGAGTIGTALARHAVAAGHKVTLSNSRGPDTLAELVAELGPLATAGTVAEAAQADIVFLAVGYLQVPDALADLPDLGGRILVDTTNQFQLIDGQYAPVDLGERTGSEVIADHAPGARVIKAFNTLYAGFIEPDPRHEVGRQVVFYAGDDAEAKTTFEAVLDEFGFAPVDVGGLRDGGRLMQVDGGPLSALHVLRQD
jgi:8-hydroxy-5-deazaflavin:NADPH oxidoreductase